MYLLRVLTRPEQHRRVTLQHVPRQVNERQVQIRKRRRDLPGEAVAGDGHRREELGKGAVGVGDGAGDSVAVEGDPNEVGERRDGGWEGAGEGVVGEVEGDEGLDL